MCTGLVSNVALVAALRPCLLRSLSVQKVSIVETYREISKSGLGNVVAFSTRGYVRAVATADSA